MSNDRTAPGGLRAAPRRTAARQLPQSSHRPPYRLLADVLRKQIRAGRLAPGSQVPPYRVLEEDYGIANMTARAAVRVLRDEGLVRTVQGLGTFVADPLPPFPDVTGAALATADQPRMPTAEYTELVRRIDHLTDVQDALLRLLGQAARLGSQPAPDHPWAMG